MKQSNLMKYNISIYSGLTYTENSTLVGKVSVTLDKNCSENELIKEALKQLDSYPRSYNWGVDSVELVYDLESKDSDLKYKKTLENIEGLMMSISVRKTELLDAHYYKGEPKPDFKDLDWCYEQLYYLKNDYKY